MDATWLLISQPCHARPAIDKLQDKIVGMHLFDAYVERMDEASPSLKCILETEPTRIRGNVYLGTSWNASNWRQLQKYGIRAVVNCASEIRCYFTDDLTYLHLPLRDTNDCTLDDTCVASALHFLDEQSKDGGVLVHCYAGCSRSVAIIAMWLVKRFAMSFTAAYDEIRQRRGCVNMSKQLASEVQRHAQKARHT